MNPTSTQTYTPPGGLTPQAQATGSLQNALGAVQQVAQQAGSDPTSSIQGQFTNAANAALPAQTQAVNTSLTQQAGIPNLQNQQNSLGQVFQMYLADQNLAQKYSSSQLSSPNSPVYNSGLQNAPQAIQGLFTGYQNQVANPYLASPTAIVNALTQPPGQGFQGFVAPSQNTSAMSVVPNAATSLISMLGGDISTEQGLVNSKNSDYQTEYSNIMNGIGSLLGNQAEASFSQAQPGTAQSLQASLNSVKSDVARGMTFTDLLRKYETDQNMTAAKIQEMYDAQHAVPGDKWGPAQITPDLASAYGLKQTPASYANAQVKATALENTKIDALRGFGDMVKSYYDNSTNIAGVHTLNPLSGNYSTQLGVYTRQLSAALKASKSNATIQDFTNHLPGELSMNPDSSLKAHFTQLLDANALRLVADKNGNVSMINTQDFDPKKQKNVDSNSLTMDQIQTILGSL